MTTATLTLADFLLGRIAEDEADLGNVGMEMHSSDLPWWMPGAWTRERGLIECEAKRRIVELYRGATGANGSYVRGWHEASRATLAALALPYVDHPEYRDEWRP